MWPTQNPHTPQTDYILRLYAAYIATTHFSRPRLVIVIIIIAVKLLVCICTLLYIAILPSHPCTSPIIRPFLRIRPSLLYAPSQCSSPFLDCIAYLLDNFYFILGKQIFKQLIDIPMGSALRLLWIVRTIKFMSPIFLNYNTN